MEQPTDLGLMAHEFWQDPYCTRDTVVETLRSQEFVGLALDAPPAVDLDAHTTVPAVLLQGTTLVDADTLVFENETVAVAVDTVTGDVHVGTFVEPIVLDAPLVPPAAPSGEGLSYSLTATDLRARLDLPWTPSTLLVTALQRDRVSNRVRVRLAPSYEDPAVQAFLDEQRRAMPQSPVRPLPARPTPYYGPTQFNPPVPETAGIALAPRRLAVLGDEAGALVAGSFRLPIERRQVGGPTRHDIAALTGIYSAVVPITLVLLGRRVTGPWVLRMDVPSYDALPEGFDGGEVTGHFVVDVCALGVVPADAQTLFVYAFSGEAMAGPVPMALVDPSSLPRQRR